MRTNRKVETGEVFICDFGAAKGSMQGGVRPCVVVDNSMACTYSPCIHCVPLSSQDKKMVLHYKLKEKGKVNLVKESIALCEQYTLVDKDQLRNSIGVVGRGDLANITALCKKNFPFTY